MLLAQCIYKSITHMLTLHNERITLEGLILSNEALAFFLTTPIRVNTVCSLLPRTQNKVVSG